VVEFALSYLNSSWPHTTSIEDQLASAEVRYKAASPPAFDEAQHAVTRVSPDRMIPAQERQDRQPDDGQP